MSSISVCWFILFSDRRFHCRKCARALEELENIDDDAEAQSIHFVKIEDENLARSFGVFNVPALVFFRFGDTEDPVIYAGNHRFHSKHLALPIQ
ncbi:UNVERIFIED_CONTAM: hypothetical protein NCL1_24929 [Trichonephila clavipes]